MIRLALILSLLAICNTTLAKPLTSDTACLSYILHKESRGESRKVQRAVLDVVLNRQKLKGVSACTVAYEKGQFPYMSHKRNVIITENMLTRYLIVSNIEPVLSETYLYFNDKPLKFGKHQRKIGNLYFYR